jgi:hypothetical protein
VTGITSQTIVTVAIYSSVMAIRDRFLVAIQTIKYTEVTGCGMTFIAICPPAFVLTAVNWEILCVMVPSRW